MDSVAQGSKIETRSSLAPNSVEKKPIRVTINGQEAQFGKGIAPPRLVLGRAYARVCSISKLLGVEMFSNATLMPASETGGKPYTRFNNIEVNTADLKMILPMNSHEITINGQKEIVSQAAYVIDDEAFFPVRLVAERLGYTVDWDDNLRMVILTKPKNSD